MKKNDLFKRKIDYFLLIPLPLLLILFSGWIRDINGPYFMLYRYDPEYSYLLNGIRILKLLPPSHVDHPGTTLQLFIGFIIGLRHLITDYLLGKKPLVLDVLQNSEIYLTLIHNTLITITALLYFFLAIYIYRKENLAKALIFQVSPFLSLNILRSLERISPEPALIIIMLITISLLLFIGHNRTKISPIWQPIALGIIIGCGIFTKITFLPFIFLIFWFSSWRDRIITVFTLIITSLLFAIRILPRIDYLFKWVMGLISRVGSYGSGEKGLFPDPVSTMRNIIKLIQNEPFYFLTLFIFIAWQMNNWTNDKSIKKIEKFRGIIITGILFIQLAMVSKFPRPYYLIPSLTFMGFMILWVTTKPGINTHKFSSNKYQIYFLVIIIGLAILNTYNLISSTKNSSGKNFEEAKEIDNYLLSNYNNCIVIPYYGASNLLYALSLGNNFAGRIFSDELFLLYTNNNITYNIWGKTYYSFGLPIEKDDMRQLITKNECVLMRGGDYLIPSSVWNNPDLVLEPILTKSVEKVYRLREIK